MYDDLKISTAQRIVEIREIIDFIKPSIPAPPTNTPRHLNTLKGIVYVQLYGLIEYTVLQLVSQTIGYINQANLKLSEIKPQLYSLALHTNLDSLMHANTVKWDKRHDLFNNIEIDSKVLILNNLLPTDGKNITDSQVRSICNAFCITEPYYPNVRYPTILKEIVGHRINIAHGNLTAAEIGSAVEISRLELRLTEVSNFCSHIINVFDDYIINAKYKS
jgi:hypothetical protein